MPSYQQYTILGHCGRDPELRYTQQGRAVCDWSVAVSEHWTDKQSGEKREKTSWVKCTAWAALAETCNQYLRKGDLVMVIGTVEASAYLAQDGTAKSSLDMTAQTVKFFGKRDDQQEQEGGERLPF